MQFAAFFIGTIVGSFLNVLILRHGVKGIGGRSGCLSCRHTLSALDLVPIVSWLSLKGRCRYCRSAVSLQYPLVEAATGILFAFVSMSETSVMGLVLGCVIVALMVMIAAYDMRHTIIPDEWVYALIGASFLYALNLFPTILVDTFLYYLSADAFLTAVPLYLLYAVSGGRWMGFGDVKLCIAIGLLIGWPLGILAVMSSFIIGAVVLVPLLLLGKVAHTGRFGFLPKGLTMKSEVAFGPFLIAATLLIWLSHLNDPFFFTALF